MFLLACSESHAAGSVERVWSRFVQYVRWRPAWRRIHCDEGGRASSAQAYFEASDYSQFLTFLGKPNCEAGGSSMQVSVSLLLLC